MADTRIPGAEATLGFDALIRAFAAARTTREEADARTKALRLIEDRAAADLFDAMERQNVPSLKHELGTFGLNDLAWAKIEDSAALVAWAQDNEPELLTVNNQRLSVEVREWLKGERPEIPPGVSYTTTRKIRWSGRKGGGSDD